MRGGERGRRREGGGRRIVVRAIVFSIIRTNKSNPLLTIWAGPSAAAGMVADASRTRSLSTLAPCRRCQGRRVDFGGICALLSTPANFS